MTDRRAFLASLPHPLGVSSYSQCPAVGTVPDWDAMARPEKPIQR